MVVGYCPWFHYVCSYYVALEKNFKAKEWERIHTRQSHLDKQLIFEVYNFKKRSETPTLQ